MSKRWPFISFGIPDELFIRGKVPMTKEEVRAVVMSKLRLNKDSVLADVGAGTGSVSIEAALHATEGYIYSIEYKAEAIALIEENKRAFGADNINIIAGRGAEALKGIPAFDRIFIGGSDGELAELIKIAADRLPEEGRLVLTTVTIENLYHAMAELKQRGFEAIEVIALGISKGRSTGKYTLMAAQNSINIISAMKGASK